ncbi:hypothetical protein, partial [Vibrio parahaemolyticus]
NTERHIKNCNLDSGWIIYYKISAIVCIYLASKNKNNLNICILENAIAFLSTLQGLNRGSGVGATMYSLDSPSFTHSSEY